MKIANLIGGIILLVIGAFYALLSHTIHISSGLDFGLSHGTHLIIGIVALIIGVIVLIMGKR